MHVLVFVSVTGLSSIGPIRILVSIFLASGGFYPNGQLTHFKNMSKGIICCMVRLSMFENMQGSLPN